MSNSEPLVIHVDPEHTGLRVAIIAILFVALWLSYFLVRWLLETLAPHLAAPGILACFGALPLTLLLAWLAENALKQRWHSGRRLLLADHELRLERSEGEEQTLDLDAPLLQLWWTFPLALTRAGAGNGECRLTGAAWPASCGRTKPGSSPSVSSRPGS